MATPASAQRFSIGVIGGVGLTNAFEDQTFSGLNARIHFYSNTKDYIVGPTVELRLPLHLGVEFDALYRPMHLTESAFITVAPSFTSSNTITSWEFPLLGKFRFPLPLINPFIVAGPSFRAAGQSLAGLSNHGFTLGGGAEIHFSKLRISPQVRYTHWASDTGTNAFPQPFSSVNQAEFLVGLTF